MCSEHVLRFCDAALPASQVKGRSVLEVGSYNVNGSARSLVMRHGPREYGGVDIRDCDHSPDVCPTPCVDQICDVGDLLAEFGADRFDVVLCTELLEHVQDWKRAIHNLKGVLKPGGLLVLTTRSPGFPKHDYPADYWRFTWGDFGIIFDDLEIEKLQDEVAAAGIFISARKPAKMLKNDLSGYNVYSMDRPAPFFYVVRRGTDSPRIEQAIRSHRTYLSAEALAHRLNQAIGWDCFGVVRGEWTGDNTYTAKWV